MDGRSLGVPSQHLISKSETHMISQEEQEATQCSRPKWYYSKREIDDHSPSRKDGVDFKKETRLRSLYCSFVQDLGMKLKVPQMTIATAMMFCHRFYLHQSHAKNDWQTIATVSVFLACKVEETPRLLVDVIVVAYETIHKRDPSASQRIKQKDVYEKEKALILIGERLLMATIGFDFNLHHPYKPLVAALKKLDISQNDVAKVAWNFVNDWLRTTLCLQHKPHYIAAGSMYLAAKFCKVKLPSEKGKVWWMEFDVSPRQLEEVIKQMLSLLEKNKEPEAEPSSSSSQTQATTTEVAKTTPSCSPQPCVVNACDSMNIDEENKKKKPSSSSSSSHVAEPCVVNGDLSQSQTSDCGSCQSVVEDEGEVQVRFQKPDFTKIVSLHEDGLSKIDKDRIKETLRKRKFEKAAKTRVVVVTKMLDDEDDWIVKELEDGIVEEKKQRL